MPPLSSLLCSPRPRAAASTLRSLPRPRSGRSRSSWHPAPGWGVWGVWVPHVPGQPRFSQFAYLLPRVGTEGDGEVPVVVALC